MKKGIFKHSDETKRKISQTFKGRHHSPSTEFKKGRKSPRFWLGKKMSDEHKKKLSLAHKKLFSQGYVQWNTGLKGYSGGESHYNWKGGTTAINDKIRHSIEYKLWRTAVFERDNFTCVWCGEKGGKLNADHIKKFADYPELRFAIDNGRTLCEPCHKTTDNYMRKGTKKP